MGAIIVEVADMDEMNCGFDVEAVGPPVVSVVEKAITLLAEFGPASTVCGLSELSRRSGLPKSTAHRLLGVLIRFGMVERYGQGYRSGQRLQDIAERLYDPHQALRDALLPFAADAYGMTHKTVQLSVLRGRDVVNVEVLRGPNAL